MPKILIKFNNFIKYSSLREKFIIIINLMIIKSY